MRCHADSLAAIRSALGDAAHLADAMASDAASAAGPGRARVATEAAMRRVGDAIWALRERIEVTP